MFKGYVINLDRRPDRLNKFNQHLDAKFFKRLPAVDRKLLELIGDLNLFFNTDLLKEQIGRNVTMGEIACTLSHIKTWNLIANDYNLSDDDFVIIAEDDVQLAPNFSNCINILKRTVQTIPDINIVILQRLFSGEALSNQPICQLEIRFEENTGDFNDKGSSLYMIKKSYTKILIQWLQKNKPYWLADHFSSFSEIKSIATTHPLLGYVPDDAESDLENDRNQARKEQGWIR